MADLVVHSPALYGEGSDAARVARETGVGDVALEAVEVKLEGLELELGRRRLQRSCANHELGDEPRERLVARWQAGGGRAQPAAQVGGGLARRGRGEVVVDVDGCEPRLPLVGQREAVGKERAL